MITAQIKAETLAADPPAHFPLPLWFRPWICQLSSLWAPAHTSSPSLKTEWLSFRSCHRAPIAGIHRNKSAGSFFPLMEQSSQVFCLWGWIQCAMASVTGESHSWREMSTLHTQPRCWDLFPYVWPPLKCTKLVWQEGGKERWFRVSWYCLLLGVCCVYSCMVCPRKPQKKFASPPLPSLE